MPSDLWGLHHQLGGGGNGSGLAAGHPAAATALDVAGFEMSFHSSSASTSTSGAKRSHAAVSVDESLAPAAAADDGEPAAKRMRGNGPEEFAEGAS